ncbi:hypothetical protein BDV59DRAFT_129828 [Aspergillus ambiguus]|uniref:uncharacterized protein n=1 Tax=Aspergillus ambiguus TaxID=176160 RepID=UPI003CCD190F
MTTIGKRRSRIATGCQRCRARHLKCDLSRPSCAACKLAGEHCHRSFNVRFRSVMEWDDEEIKTFSQVGKSQLIVGPIQIHDETHEIERLYNNISAKDQTGGNGTLNHLRVGIRTPNDCHGIGNTDVPLTNLPRLLPAQEQTNGARPDVQYPQNLPSYFSSDISGTTEEIPFASGCTESAHSSRLESQLSEREAILMRNFVENMALWADATDPHQHFGVYVPSRAMSEPVLRFAIFAFSSRHLDRQINTNAAEALHYHNRCLQLLIPVLSGSEDRINDVVLAAVAILRQLEEMDWEDNQFHLTGTTRILNTMSHVGSSGGLGEAAAWLCLREDIQISLTSQKPLRTDLQSFSASDVFNRTDDYAWANRMVFLLAKVLKFAFKYDERMQTVVLRNVDEEIEHWNIMKPNGFNPIRFVPRGKELRQRFPEIWMLLPVHVVGIQYYHIAKIVLAFTQSPTPSLTYATFRNSRNIEVTQKRQVYFEARNILI